MSEEEIAFLEDDSDPPAVLQGKAKAAKPSKKVAAKAKLPAPKKALPKK